MTQTELDVREVPKPRRHPLIFARFAALGVAESFELVNNHDPKHLRAEFERDQPGAFGWEYVESGPRTWRIKISRTAEAPAPQELCNVTELLSGAVAEDPSGAIWKLPVSERQLDANVISLGSGGRIEEHTGPDLDVLMLVLGGGGGLGTGTGEVPLTQGTLIWLPRRSRREVRAGEQGLTYLTVHPRRPALQIGQLGR